MATMAMMATKRVMVRAARPIAMAFEEGDGKSSKSNGNSVKEGIDSGGKENRD
jgi:hypothetical protein